MDQETIAAGKMRHAIHLEEKKKQKDKKKEEEGEKITPLDFKT
jgi:hypothetical protein